jgi:hypothetical protein
VAHTNNELVTEGRQPEVKRKLEVERIVKQRNSTSDNTLIWQLWRLKTSNWWTTGKQIIICICTHKCSQKYFLLKNVYMQLIH